DPESGEYVYNIKQTTLDVTVELHQVDDDPYFKSEPHATATSGEGFYGHVFTEAELPLTDIDTLNKQNLVYTLYDHPRYTEPSELAGHQAGYIIYIEHVWDPEQGKWVPQTLPDPETGEDKLVIRKLEVGDTFTQQDVADGWIGLMREGNGEGKAEFYVDVLDSDRKAWQAPTDLTGVPGGIYDWNEEVDPETGDLPLKHNRVTLDLQEFTGGGSGWIYGDEGETKLRPVNADALTVYEGQAVVLTKDYLKYESYLDKTDPRHPEVHIEEVQSPDSVIYHLQEKLEHGELQIDKGSLDEQGVWHEAWTSLPVNTAFTQQDINDGKVRYLHDGGEGVDESVLVFVNNGNTGEGSHGEFQLKVEVASVNDAPSATATEVRIKEYVEGVTKNDEHIARFDDTVIKISDPDVRSAEEEGAEHDHDPENAKDDLWFRFENVPANFGSQTSTLEYWDGLRWVALTSANVSQIWFHGSILTDLCDGAKGGIRYVHGGSDAPAALLETFKFQVVDNAPWAVTENKVYSEAGAEQPFEPSSEKLNTPDGNAVTKVWNEEAGKWVYTKTWTPVTEENALWITGNNTATGTVTVKVAPSNDPPQVDNPYEGGGFVIEAATQDRTDGKDGFQAAIGTDLQQMMLQKLKDIYGDSKTEEQLLAIAGTIKFEVTSDFKQDGALTLFAEAGKTEGATTLGIGSTFTAVQVHDNLIGFLTEAESIPGDRLDLKVTASDNGTVVDLGDWFLIASGDKKEFLVRLADDARDVTPSASVEKPVEVREEEGGWKVVLDDSLAYAIPYATTDLLTFTITEPCLGEGASMYRFVDGVPTEKLGLGATFTNYEIHGVKDPEGRMITIGYFQEDPEHAQEHIDDRLVVDVKFADGGKAVGEYVLRMTGDTAENEVTVSLVEVSREFDVTVNMTPTIGEGGEVVITDRWLKAVDPDNTAKQLQYTLSSTVQHGTLYLDGKALSNGSPFTQEDIDEGRLVYVHDGFESVKDTFYFTVSDSTSETAVKHFDILIEHGFNDLPELTIKYPLLVRTGTGDDPIELGAIEQITIDDDDLNRQGLAESEGLAPRDTDIIRVEVKALLEGDEEATFGVDGQFASLVKVDANGQIVLMGEFADVQAALATLVMNPTTDFNRIVTVNVTVDDRVYVEREHEPGVFDIKTRPVPIEGGGIKYEQLANGGWTNNPALGEEGEVVSDDNNVVVKSFRIYSSHTNDQPEINELEAHVIEDSGFSPVKVTEEVEGEKITTFIKVTDPDAVTGFCDVVITVDNGTIRWSDGKGGWVTAGVGGSLTLHGTIEAINERLETLQYKQPGDNYNVDAGKDTGETTVRPHITVAFTDDGNPGPDAKQVGEQRLTTTRVFGILVDKVNDAPEVDPAHNTAKIDSDHEDEATDEDCVDPHTKTVQALVSQAFVDAKDVGDACDLALLRACEIFRNEVAEGPGSVAEVMQ
ncbi:MAG: hypothetical protein HUK26_04555, partial [Duodenibacillus sp.]|nr:hypothetical protein [Duodenibacillus sp.]